MTEPLGSTTDPSDEEIFHVVARTLVREQTQGLCDENYPNPCDGCDCDFDTGRSMAIGYAQEHARVALAAAVPLIRQQIAAEIEAECSAANWSRTFRNGLLEAARVARGETT